MPQYGLGRGLGALISRKTPSSQEERTESLRYGAGEKTIELPIHDIQANEYQPRSRFNESDLRGLAESIKEYGILQPLVVSRAGDVVRLIAGERRLRAAKLIGLPTVPVVFRDAEEHERLALALIENVQRVDLNLVELGMAYRRLIDEFNLTHDELARRVGKSRPTISNTLRYLGLPEEIKEDLRAGNLKEQHVRSILFFKTEPEQIAFFRELKKKNLSGIEVSNITRKMAEEKRGRQFRVNRDPDIVSREERLRDYLGTRVGIVVRGQKGCVVIDYYSPEELDALMRKILPGSSD